MARSNFNSAIPNSAWFTMFDPSAGSGVVVSTTGYGFTKSLQAVMKDTLTGTGPLASYDGHPVAASALSVDGNWGPTTFKALWALVNRMGASALAAIVRSDALAGRISRTSTMVGSVILAEALGGSGAVVPSDAVTPPYLREAPGRSSGSMITITPYSQVPSVANARPDATGDASARDLVASAVSNTGPSSSAPPPVAPPIAPPPVAPPVGGTPESQLDTHPTIGSRVSWGVVAAAAVGVAVAVALAVSLNGKSSSHGHEHAAPSTVTRRIKRRSARKAN